MDHQGEQVGGAQARLDRWMVRRQHLEELQQLERELDERLEQQRVTEAQRAARCTREGCGHRWDVHGRERCWAMVPDPAAPGGRRDCPCTGWQA
jgi:hypothetical protein